MSVIVNTMRHLISILSPLTGDKATGAITIKSLAGDVDIKAGAYGVPIVDGQLNYDAMVKTTAAVTATTAGVDVNVIAAQGGARANLPAGTKIRWDYPIDGVEPVSVVASGGLTGGVTPTGFGAVQLIKIYEQIGSAQTASDLFNAKVGRFPAIVLSWDSSQEPTDVEARLSQDTVLCEERWLLSVISSRVDSTEQRRQEGLEVLENATDLLAGRTESDGCVFSYPRPLRIGRRSRIAVAPSSYVYSLEFTTMRARTRKEWRTFAPWLTNKIRETTQSGVEPEVVLVNDIIVPMLP